MGKVPIAVCTLEMTRKRKGRHPKNRPPPKSPSSNPTNCRSTRRNPNYLNSPLSQPEFDDDDDERKEKKVKLVVRLPHSDENINADRKRQPQRRRHSRELDSCSMRSGSESDPEPENPEECAKKRKIDGVEHGSDDGISDQDKEVVKERGNSVQESPLESSPTTPLPEKKMLIFVLDRLQKKDTYGVFSDPVDPNELPEYFDIIDQPMDFGTIRKKFDNGDYKSLEELEADVFLICSNAMQYNSAHTVYYRKARTIQDLAKKDFDNLRNEGEPKVIRRGRPPNSQNQKKVVEIPPADRVVNEPSAAATIAKEENKTTGSNSYNLRKGSAYFRFRSTGPFRSSHGSRNGENHSEWSIDWNNEFPASILRADMKYGKKQFTVDENKRDTYKLPCLLSSGHNSLVLLNSCGNTKSLVPVGLQDALAYARSLARYAANLGPVAWKMALRKIEAVLPAGVRYGPGWVGEKEVPSRTSSSSVDNHKSIKRPHEQIFNSNDGLSGMPSEFTNSGNPKVKSHPGSVLSTSESRLINDVVREQAKTVVEIRNYSLPPGYPVNEQGKGKASSQETQTNGKSNNSIYNNMSGTPPDLNLRVHAGLPSSRSLLIASPQPQDLVLQL